MGREPGGRPDPSMAAASQEPHSGPASPGSWGVCRLRPGNRIGTEKGEGLAAPALGPGQARFLPAEPKSKTPPEPLLTCRSKKAQPGWGLMGGRSA